MADTYDLTKIAALREVMSWRNGEPGVNDYLGKGWLLLATPLAGDMQTGQNVIYVMGWPREMGKPQYPTMDEYWTRA